MTPANAIALVGFLGFAIQRVIEFLLALLALLVGRFARRELTSNEKTVATGLIGVLTGLGLCYSLDLDVVAIGLGKSGVTFGGQFVSALVIASGAEGVNSATKFLEYAKEAKKSETPKLEGILPGEAKCTVKTPINMLAKVSGKDAKVMWALLQNPGGADTRMLSQGSRMALTPPAAGEYIVVAYLEGDSNAAVTAKVTVTEPEQKTA